MGRPGSPSLPLTPTHPHPTLTSLSASLGEAASGPRSHIHACPAERVVPCLDPARPRLCPGPGPRAWCLQGAWAPSIPQLQPHLPPAPAQAWFTSEAVTSPPGLCFLHSTVALGTSRVAHLLPGALGSLACAPHGWVLSTLLPGVLLIQVAFPTGLPAWCPSAGAQALEPPSVGRCTLPRALGGHPNTTAGGPSRGGGAH